jgi:hypothetical protein
MAPRNSRKEPRTISRREFARRAALGAAGVAAVSAGVISPLATPPASAAIPPAEDKPKLSAAAQAEAEDNINAIFRKYGERLSEEQKTDIRRMVLEGQEPLEQLRAYPLANSDEPATVLRFRRKAAPAAHGKKPAAAAKKGA